MKGPTCFTSYLTWGTTSRNSKHFPTISSDQVQHNRNVGSIQLPQLCPWHVMSLRAPSHLKPLETLALFVWTYVNRTIALWSGTEQQSWDHLQQVVSVWLHLSILTEPTKVPGNWCQNTACQYWWYTTTVCDAFQQTVVPQKYRNYGPLAFDSSHSKKCILSLYLQGHLCPAGLYWFAFSSVMKW